MSNTVSRSPLLMSASDSVLLIVDAQDKLLPLMRRATNARLESGATGRGGARAARAESGDRTVPRETWAHDVVVADLLGARHPHQPAVPSKLTFSCAGCRPLMAALQQTGRRQVVIGGLETHVCVLQTACDLTTAGYDVFLVVDALGTRHALDHETALRRLEATGITLTTTEGVLFEWCERAGTSEFKQISQLVRQSPPDEDAS